MLAAGTDPAVADVLKAAMRGLACSVSIVSTANNRGERAAMTATSVTSLSLSPPAMLVCINRDAWIYDILRHGADFCINVLAVDQIALAQTCSGRVKGPDRFAVGAWQEQNGLPLLADAQAAIICHQERRLSFGTHDIIVGSVSRVLTSNAIDPLLYVNGGYARVGAAV